MGNLEKWIKESEIEEQDRDAVLATVRNYSGLQHNKDANQQKKVSKFWSKYYSGYKDKVFEEEQDRRTLFVQSLQRITSLASKPYCVREGHNLCRDFFGIGKAKKPRAGFPIFKPLPTRAISSWIGSLDHLSTEWSRKNIDYRFARYLRLCRSNLIKYHPSHIHVLDLLSQRGPLYGFERFMLDLSKDQELNFDGVANHFEVLQSVPIDLREGINKLRGNLRLEVRKKVRKKIRENKEIEEKSRGDLEFDELKSIDRKLYDLLSLSQNNFSSAGSIASILNMINQEIKGDLEELVLNSTQPLNEIITRDRRVLRYSVNQVSGIIELQNLTEMPLVIPYLESMSYISGLNCRRKDKFTYASLSAEMMRDHFRGKESPFFIDKVRDNIHATIGEFQLLDRDSKEIALRIMRKSIKRLKGKDRLRKGSNPLFIDRLGRSIVQSVSIDGPKAEYFFDALLNQSELESKNGQD